MRRLGLLLFILLGAVDPGLAQTPDAAPGASAAPAASHRLPLRNLLIEVIQEDQDTGSRTQVDAAVAARVTPDAVDARVTLDARSRQREQTGNAHQQILVLNGRPAAIKLGSQLPLRLRQTIVRNGVRLAVPSTVWLQAGTGFRATPVWEGGDSVYLDLAAAQDGQALRDTSSNASTTIVLPLGEWVTVAENEETRDERQGAAGLSGGGQATHNNTRRLRVRVRVQLR